MPRCDWYVKWNKEVIEGESPYRVNFLIAVSLYLWCVSLTQKYWPTRFKSVNCIKKIGLLMLTWFRKWLEHLRDCCAKKEKWVCDAKNWQGTSYVTPQEVSKNHAVSVKFHWELPTELSLHTISGFSTNWLICVKHRVGKQFLMLVDCWSIQNKRRVVVSSITLSEKFSHKCVNIAQSLQEITRTCFSTEAQTSKPLKLNARTRRATTQCQLFVLASKK